MKKEKKEENTDKVEEAMARLQKKYGSEVLIKMDEELHSYRVEAIPTGCFSLDAALGCGGLPRGRLIEVFGKESSGKSTLATFLMAQIQKAGGKAALIDAEMAFDGQYAAALGVDVSKLMVAQPGSLEEGMGAPRALVNTHVFDIIVIDSVAALVPKSEIEGDEMLKDSMAVQARLLGKALRILAGEIAKSKTVVIFINQVRDKIGVFYGAKTVTPGGRALKFFSSIRMDVSAGDKILGKNEEQIGNWLKIKMAKNKTAPPWREAEFELFYARGIDLAGDALDYGERIGVIKKSGNTYSFDGKELGVGREKAKKAITENASLFEKIKEQIKTTNDPK